MPRRGDHTPEQLSGLIVAAARERIAREGVEALSARQIAADVGYSVGMLYHQFRNLDEIVTQVNGVTLRDLGAAFAGAERSDDPKRMLHNYGDAFLGFCAEHKNLWNALFEFRRDPEAPVPDWYVGAIRQLVSVVADCFEAIEPRAGREAAVEAGQLVFASIQSVSSLQSSGRLSLVMDKDIRSVVHRIIDLHIAGYAHHPEGMPAP
jgi:AcrR family transcriptional regulator